VSELTEQESSSDDKYILLRRDCVGQMVPAGTKLILQRGTEVKITQALGDSYTVLVFGNLVRIAGDDADALGLAQDDVLKDIDQSLPLEQKVWEALKTVFDPEIPVSIVDLGLIYDCQISENGDEYDVAVQMTLTSPTCAMGPVLVNDVEVRVASFPEVATVDVELVLDPPWTRERMSESARLELGMF
jgi:probable FeS assembly SUF system protein SufT